LVDTRRALLPSVSEPICWIQAGPADLARLWSGSRVKRNASRNNAEKLERDLGNGCHLVMNLGWIDGSSSKRASAPRYGCWPFGLGWHDGAESESRSSPVILDHQVVFWDGLFIIVARDKVIEIW
jgi:hypothetical protein